MEYKFTKAAESDPKVREEERQQIKAVLDDPQRRRMRVKVEMYEEGRPDDVLAEFVAGDDPLTAPNNVIVLTETNHGPAEQRGVKWTVASEFRSTYRFTRLLELEHLDPEAMRLHLLLAGERAKAVQQAAASRPRIFRPGEMPR